MNQDYKRDHVHRNKKASIEKNLYSSSKDFRPDISFSSLLTKT